MANQDPTKDAAKENGAGSGSNYWFYFVLLNQLTTLQLCTLSFDTWASTIVYTEQSTAIKG